MDPDRSLLNMKMDFDAALRKQSWNTQPRVNSTIPSSNNPLINAARAIAITAYPAPQYHVEGGKAPKYSEALLAYIFRIAKRMGNLDNLPSWAASMKVEAMERHLFTGHRNLQRAFKIRDLINSALTMKGQRDDNLLGRKSTFELSFSPDLNSMGVKIPYEKTVSGYILSGCIPNTRLASLRSAMMYHRPALIPFEGPAVKIDGRDTEHDYQNTYNRYVRPALFAQHIVQVVWEQATEHMNEAIERGIPIDQILIRKATWATDIHQTTADSMSLAIHVMRELGVPSCHCAMVRFANPLPDS